MAVLPPVFCLFVWVDALRPRSLVEVMSGRFVLPSVPGGCLHYDNMPMLFRPSLLYKPRCEKTGLWGFRPGPTQPQKMARGVKFSDLGSRGVAKTKALISCAVTDLPLCFRIRKSRFSHFCSKT